MADPTAFDTWFNDPMTQIGMGLLANTHTTSPLGNALSMVMAQRGARSKQALEQAQAQELQQHGPLYAAQAAQVQQQMANQQALMKMLPQVFGQSPGAVGQPPPSPALPAPQSGSIPGSATPSMTPSDYSNAIPPKLLDNLSQVESSGNPLAVNPTSGAMGQYQFMPATLSMLRDQGTTFDPFNPQQSRSAAAGYLGQLLAQHGGDYPKALAAYGGFQKADPTAYISKVMNGVQLPQVGAQPATPSIAQALPQSGPNPANVAQFGLLAGALGSPMAGPAMEYAKMLQPQAVPPGYLRDINGNTVYLPDPNKAIEHGQKQQEIGLQTTEQSNKNVEAMNKTIGAQMERYGAFQADKDSLFKAQTTSSNLVQNIDSMAQFDAKGNPIPSTVAPGFDQMTGATGALLRKIPGTQAYDMHQKLESLVAQTKFEVISGMKNAAGQTGLGRVLQSEFTAMGESAAAIDPNMSTPALLKSLYSLRQIASRLQSHAENDFASKYGALPGADQQGLPVAAPGATPGGIYSNPQAGTLPPAIGGTPAAPVAPVAPTAGTKIINGKTYRPLGGGKWEQLP